MNSVISTYITKLQGILYFSLVPLQLCEYCLYFSSNALITCTNLYLLYRLLRKELDLDQQNPPLQVLPGQKKHGLQHRPQLIKRNLDQPGQTVQKLRCQKDCKVFFTISICMLSIYCGGHPHHLVLLTLMTTLYIGFL